MNAPRFPTRALTAAVGACLSFAAATSASAQTIAIQSQLAISGLDRPVGVYAPPGDSSRIFVLQQTGQVLVYSLPAFTLLGTYLDLSITGLDLSTRDLVPGDERGLLGLAFHPEFATNGFFYVNYTSRTNGSTNVRRYTANAPFTTSTSANTGTGTSLLNVGQDFSNHNGGSIRFGPDRMLYVFMGDGGNGGDPNNRAQDDTQLLGKILRLDVNDTINGGDGDGSFIPDNNPFRALGNPRDKIWAKGVRNPWRSTFDRVTGEMWVADVGQATYEEVNVAPAIQLANPLDGNSAILNSAAVASLNYGWDCREGLQVCPTNTTSYGCDPNAGGYFDPIVDYSHSFGCSISGGYVYRGTAIPALDGVYFYADYCTATTHRVLKYNGTSITFHADITDQLQFNGANLQFITSYGEDGDGELYMCVAPSNNSPGSIYKIVPFAVPCGCPCTAPGATVLFSDSFDTNTGWTIASDAGVTAGSWVRGQPSNVLNWQWDPMSDADGTGWCCMTGNSTATNNDLDGGATRLTSPALDFTAGEISICYSYQFATAAQTANDGLFTEVSSNGTAGPWTIVATHQVDNSTRWIPHSVSQADLTAAGVTNTPDMRIRFRAIDADGGNNVEAAIDAVQILSSGAPECPCDWDDSGTIGVPDIFAFLSSWFANEPAANFDGQDGVGVPDIFAFLTCWFAGCD